MVYEGQWVKNNFNEGIVTYYNGDIYIGELSIELKHG